MSPERSPGSLAPGAGVRRANNIPLYLVIGLIAVVALVVAMVASDRARQQAQLLKSTTGPQQQGKGGGTLALADRIAGSHLGGVIPAAPSKPLMHKELTQPETALAGAGSLDGEGPVKADILIARPDDLDAPPMPNRAGGLQLVTGKPLSKTPSSESGRRSDSPGSNSSRTHSKHPPPSPFRPSEARSPRRRSRASRSLCRPATSAIA